MFVDDECGCHLEGCSNTKCDPTTGQCPCKCAIQGLKCDECIDLHWNFPDCEDNGLYFKLFFVILIFTYCYNVVCDCDEDGSEGLICDKTTGQCPCKLNVIGRQCRMCKEGYKEHPYCTGTTRLSLPNTGVLGSGFQP